LGAFLVWKMTRGALSFISQSFLFLAFTSVRGVLVLQPHEVDGSEGTKERGSEGNVSYLERMGLACK
jgi:hypothetical protein